MNVLARRLAELQTAVRDLRSRVFLIAARAVLRLTDEPHGQRRVQVGLLRGETRDRVEHMETYGLSARPLAGAEAVVLFLGGHRDHPIALSTPDRRHRPQDLQPGAVSLHSFRLGNPFRHEIRLDEQGRVSITSDHGQRVLLDELGQVEITSDHGQRVLLDTAGDMHLTCGTLRVMGDVQVTGDIDATGHIIDAGGNTNHHSH